jgi:hypothetical protein
MEVRPTSAGHVERSGMKVRLVIAEHLRQIRQPLRRRGGLVVDDVVDAGCALLEREHRRGRSILEVDERGDAVAPPDDRELPFADRLDQPVVVRAVEPAVPQDGSAGARHRFV